MEIHKTENYTEFLECTENYFAGNVQSLTHLRSFRKKQQEDGDKKWTQWITKNIIDKAKYCFFETIDNSPTRIIRENIKKA